MKNTHTWEEAVEWLRNQTDRTEFVQHCYFDDPLEQAAQRFSTSEEWASVKSMLDSRMPSRVLDVGAGRGISSYAFARCNCEVTALEPYPSELVGSGAIKALSEKCKLKIDIAEESGESMPFEDNSFDIVYCRAALHHANSLRDLCAEVARVLRPGGVFLATREHVLSKREDLTDFLESHSLHYLYGGENAYTLPDYKRALMDGGLQIVKVLGPYDDVINYAPMTRVQLKEKIEGILSNRFGAFASRQLIKSNKLVWLTARYLSRKSVKPGRHYSFLTTKTK